MKYKDALKQSMEELAKDEKTVFIGYNIKCGSQFYGSLKEIPPDKKIETPVAEGLMAGLAVGLSLEGFKPVLLFERQDFMLIALDVIVNHLDKLEEMSDGEFRAPVIIRAISATLKKPLDPGPQHCQDFSKQFKEMVSFPVLEPKTPEEVLECYEKAQNSSTPVMIIEKRELYENE